MLEFRTKHQANMQFKDIRSLLARNTSVGQQTFIE